MKFINLGLFLLILLIGCEKEENATIVDSKPIQLETTAPEKNAIDKIIIAGRVLHLNDEKIVDHGFICGSGDTIHTVSLGNKLSLGKITADLTSNVRSILGTSFPYYFFIKTEKNLYKGKELELNVEGFSPDWKDGILAVLGEKMTITGDFANINPNSFNLIYSTYENKNVPYTLSADRSAVSFEMPLDLRTGQVTTFYFHSKEKPPNQVSQYTLANITPLGIIDVPVKYEYNLNELLSIYGQGLNFSDSDDVIMEIIIGDKKIPLQIEMLVSDFLKGTKETSFRYGYYNGRDTIIFPKKFTLRTPKNENISFNSTRVHPNGTTYAYIRPVLDFYNYDDVRLTMAGIPVDLYTIWNQYDQITVPNLPEGLYPITFANSTFTYTPKATIKVEKLTITSYSKKDIHSGDNVIFYGNFIPGENYFLQYGHEIIDFQAQSPTNATIRMYISGTGKNIPVKIGYKNKLEQITYSEASLNFNISGPEIHSISPKSGKPGDVVTIKGKGLFSGYFFFGDQRVFIESGTTDAVTLIVPESTFKGKVRISNLTNAGWVYSPEYFEIK